MRLLGIDPGTVRIGFALSDALGIARPLEVWKRKTPEDDLARIAAIIAEHEVEGIVIGVPYRLDGSESAATERARALIARIRARFPDMPLVERDEALTTWEATERIKAEGRTPTKDLIDAYAAAVILQEELDHRLGPPKLPDDD